MLFAKHQYRVHRLHGLGSIEESGFINSLKLIIRLVVLCHTLVNGPRDTGWSLQ